MNENNPKNFNGDRLPDDIELNIREILFKYLRHWYWFVITVATCFLAVYFYLRYATPVYKVTSEIIIKEDKGNRGSSQNILSELDIFNTKSNVTDEIEILKTRYLMQKVVGELQLNINYYLVGKIKTSDVYNTAPFYITLLSRRDSIPLQKFQIEEGKNAEFNIINNDIKTTHRFDDTINTPDLKMIVHKRQGIDFKGDNYLLYISSPDEATDAYLNSVTPEMVDKKSNVIQMTINTTVPSKGEAILTKLYQIYTRVNQEDKNRIVDSTISFINDRLAKVADELKDVETNVEQFKRNNNISTDLRTQSGLLLENVSELDKMITDQEVKTNVVESIERHLNSNAFRVVPGALVIQDPTYMSMVEKYNTLVLERDNQLQTTKEANPIIKSLNQQVLNLKADLLTSLSNIKRGMGIAKSELSQKKNRLVGEISLVPSKERAFIEISRQQVVKQQLYLYLLQKREETAISKSGTLANSRMIEPPISGREPFSPKRKLIYLYALIAGLVIPAGLVHLKDLLNNKITSKEDITRATKVPIFGELGHNNTGEIIIARQDARTVLAEQFRLMRTNLHFILKGNTHQVILLTSSMSGEGKSFLSINLALSLAISGKKVALMEMDLRRPKVSKVLGLSGNKGFTNFVVEDMPVSSLLQQTALNPNLFVISAGPIPPNPAELILMEKVTTLFDYLRKEFDFIIVDTAPVGLVTDALLVSKYADANIYVVRQNYTLKEHINIINDLAINAKMANMSILINDVKNKGSYGYGYGYGYGGKGYYTDQPEKKSFFRRWKKGLNKG